MKKYRVIFDKILVKRDPAPEEQEGGILMPHDVQKPPRNGKVLAIGSKVTEVKVGDTVFFNEYAGNFLHSTADLAEPDLIVMREDEALAIEDA